VIHGPGIVKAVLLTELAAGSRSAPPSRPWVEIAAADAPIGFVAVYYSDPTSRLPVREVTRPGDNKSDPNFETGTFGLFSTCERGMRSGVRGRQAGRLFFMTSHRGQPRAVTGFYDLGWWAWGKLSGSPHDVCLAAREIWFLEKPIPLSKLPGLSRSALSTGFRTTKLLDAKVTAQLEKVIRSRPDASASYLDEVDRLERFNLRYTGSRCWQRAEPFSWKHTSHLIDSKPADSAVRAITNSSPNGRWTCKACNHELSNQSRLKECPECHGLDTLEPAA
jgi:hypothetical protein